MGGKKRREEGKNKTIVIERRENVEKESHRGEDVGSTGAQKVTVRVRGAIHAKEKKGGNRWGKWGGGEGTKGAGERGTSPGGKGGDWGGLETRFMRKSRGE